MCVCVSVEESKDFPRIAVARERMSMKERKSAVVPAVIL